MAFPSKAKTYEFSVNNAITYTTQETLMSAFLSDIYNFFTGASSNPWILRGSSNGVTAGWPGPGWGSTGSVVWANEGTAHSWAVFENAAGTVQILFNCHNNNALTLQLGEWTSGTGDAANGPTAVASLTAVSDDPHGTNQAGTYRFSFIHADDGELDFAIMTDPGHSVRTVYCLSKLQSAIAGFTNPWTIYAYPWATYYTADNFHRYDPSYSYGMWEYNCWHGFQAGPLGSISNVWRGRPVIEAGMGFALGENVTAIPNEISGNWGMYPVAMCGYTTGDYGVIGAFEDFYFVGPGMSTGDTVEANAASPTFDWAVFGEFAVPWETGTAPIV